MRTLYWDFFGPAAEPTAKHFEKHLVEFLRQNACADAETGVSSAGEGHRAVWCRSRDEQAEAIAGALRPRRSEAS